MHTFYYISTYDKVTTHPELFNAVFCHPLDLAHETPILGADSVVVAALFMDNASKDKFEALPGITPCGDALRNQAIEAPALAQLTQFGLTPTSTVFDLSDVLKTRWKDMQFEIR